MVKIVKEGKAKSKKSVLTMAQYKLHKKRLEKMDKDGTLEIYLKGRGALSKEQKELVRGNKLITGTRKKFTPKEFKQKIDEYFKVADTECKEIIGKDYEVRIQVPYTIEALCNHIGIFSNNFRIFETGEGYEEYHHIARMARQKIIDKILKGGLLNDLNSNIAKFYLKNISGLKENIADTEGNRIGSINIVTVNNREERKELEETEDSYNGEILDAEVVPEHSDESTL